MLTFFFGVTKYMLTYKKQKVVHAHKRYFLTCNREKQKDIFLYIGHLE